MYVCRYVRMTCICVFALACVHVACVCFGFGSRRGCHAKRHDCLILASATNQVLWKPMWSRVLHQPAKNIEKSVDAKRQRCGSDGTAAASSARDTGAADKMARGTLLLSTDKALSSSPERQAVLYRRLAQKRPWLRLSVEATSSGSAWTPPKKELAEEVSRPPKKVPRAALLLSTGEEVSRPPRKVPRAALHPFGWTPDHEVAEVVKQEPTWFLRPMKVEGRGVQARRGPHATTSKARGTPGAVRKTMAAKATLPDSSTDSLHQQSSDPVTQIAGGALSRSYRPAVHVLLSPGGEHHNAPMCRLHDCGAVLVLGLHNSATHALAEYLTKFFAVQVYPPNRAKKRGGDGLLQLGSWKLWKHHVPVAPMALPTDSTTGPTTCS